MILRYLMPVALFFCFSLPAPSFAATPLQKLDISFDIGAHLLHGNSEIVFPAGAEATLSLHDLQVKSLMVNGVARKLQKGERELALKAEPQERKIDLVYEKSFVPALGQREGGMISDKGIALFGFWHPSLSLDTNFKLTAEIPADFEAVSEAETITSAPTANGKRVAFSFDHPLARIDFVAGPYVVEKAPFGDGQTLYTYFFKEDRALAVQYREKALGYLTHYAKLLGPYPYRRFSIVENRLPTGYAMPTFTLLGQVVVRLPFIVNTSLGHEIAHSWFGNCVRVAADSGNWTEGLVTYLADYTFAVERGEGLRYRKNLLSRFQSYVHSHNSRSAMEFFGADFSRNQQTLAMRAIGYDKVCMIFQMLNRQLGDKEFYAGLRDFFQTMKYKRAGWDDLQRSFEKTAKVSLATFFKQWTTRNDVPRLRVDDVSYDYPNGVPQLSFILRQGNKRPYHLVVPLTLYDEGGAVVQKILQTHTRKKRFVIPLAKIPEAMSIDPDYRLMRQLEGHEFPLVWSRFEGATRKIVIVSDDRQKVFASLVKSFKHMGYKVKKASKATDNDVASGAVLFLGVDSPLVRSLFAEVEMPAEGFTLKVRPNPLAVGKVVVFVSASSAKEVAEAAYKVRHYGNYSYLHFVGGRLQEKREDKSMQGMRVKVDSPPLGIATKSTQHFKRVMDEVAGKRVVYVGEIHNAYGDHLLEFRIIRALFERGNHLAIGMEMFSRASQPGLDAYIAGKIDEKTMLRKTNYFKQWGFDYQYYREILQYARRHHIPVVGLNIKNEVAKTVFRKGGPTALTAAQRKTLPEDRDLDMPGYQDRILATYYMHGLHGAKHGKFKDFFQVQALWDETMASTVANYLAEHPKTSMVVLAGREHVLKDNAIPPRVARRIDVSQAVVVNDLPGDKNETKSDFIFFSPPAELPPPPLMGIQLDEKKGEVHIVDVAKHSPAARAGVEKGDVMLAMDGQKVRTIQDIRIEMLDKKRGDSIKVRVRRRHFFFGNEEIDLNIVL